LLPSAWIVKVEEPTALGVPLIVPLLASRVSPDGNEPELTE
jgi:hypothetical protein